GARGRGGAARGSLGHRDRRLRAARGRGAPRHVDPRRRARRRRLGRARAPLAARGGAARGRASARRVRAVARRRQLERESRLPAAPPRAFADRPRIAGRAALTVGSIGRQKASADQAASAAERDRAEVRAAGARLVAAARRTIGRPGFLVGAFAGGLLAGAAVGRRRDGSRERGDEPPRVREARIVPVALSLLSLFARLAALD